MTKDKETALVNAIRSISHGDYVPMGLEALAMSISGDGLTKDSLCAAIRGTGEEIARSLDGVADAIREQEK